MFLKEVTIKNYRAVQELNLEFKPGFNLLIGNNGAGKTSVLEAISVGLAGFLAGIDGVSAKSILHDDIHCVLNRAGDASGGIQYFTPVEIG
ncbi:AAA family ATPase, partial [Enterocloster lavalensis]|uniref:AAA family ATPase n=1 Tax=Enterocloster lavalensis TaxID=460384 RepID=UPI002FD9591F